MSSQECSQNISRARVSSTFRDDDEPKMSLPSSRTIVANHDDLKLPHNLYNRVEKSIKIVKAMNDSSARKEKLRLSAPNKQLVEKAGGPKRPGLLRAGPIEVRRGPTSDITQQKNGARFKANLKDTVYVSSATDSQSSEYYDDRSPVFGGWTSDSSDRSSGSRFRLSKLGSSESDRDYGGEEGAKQFDYVNNRDLSSHAPALSEGPAEEENKRPEWSSDSDEPEVIVFRGQLSPSVDLHFINQSHSEENEISLWNLAQSKEELEVLGDIPSSPELLRGGLEGSIISKKIVILD